MQGLFLTSYWCWQTNVDAMLLQGLQPGHFVVSLFLLKYCFRWAKTYYTYSVHATGSIFVIECAEWTKEIVKRASNYGTMIGNAVRRCLWTQEKERSRCVGLHRLLLNNKEIQEMTMLTWNELLPCSLILLNSFVINVFFFWMPFFVYFNTESTWTNTTLYVGAQTKTYTIITYIITYMWIPPTYVLRG